MAAFGVFRAAAFHPLFRSKYRALARTDAVDGRKPLPLGPIHLVWQDAVVLGIVMLALHGTLLGRVWALGAFLLAYVGTLGVSFWLTGPWWMGYIVLFGLGLSIRLAVEPLAGFGGDRSGVCDCDDRARHGAGQVPLAGIPGRGSAPSAVASQLGRAAKADPGLAESANYGFVAGSPGNPPRRNLGAAAGAPGGCTPWSRTFPTQISRSPSRSVVLLRYLLRVRHPADGLHRSMPFADQFSRTHRHGPLDNPGL